MKEKEKIELKESLGDTLADLIEEAVYHSRGLCADNNKWSPEYDKFYMYDYASDCTYFNLAGSILIGRYGLDTTLWDLHTYTRVDDEVKRKVFAVNYASYGDWHCCLIKLRKWDTNTDRRMMFNHLMDLLHQSNLNRIVKPRHYYDWPQFHEHLAYWDEVIPLLRELEL